MTDRTVHADGRTDDGLVAELARYDRAGVWYVEYENGDRCRVGIDSAAFIALVWEKSGGSIYPCRPGGRRFDAVVRRKREALQS